MMKIKDILLGKRISGLLNVINIVLGIVSIIVYTANALRLNEFNANVVIFLVIAIALEAVYLLVKHPVAELANVAACVMVTMAIGKLAIASIGTFADVVNGITMFGSSGEIGYIITLLVMMGITLLIEIVSCFMSGEAKEKAKAK